MPSVYSFHMLLILILTNLLLIVAAEVIHFVSAARLHASALRRGQSDCDAANDRGCRSRLRQGHRLPGGGRGCRDGSERRGALAQGQQHRARPGPRQMKASRNPPESFIVGREGWPGVTIKEQRRLMPSSGRAPPNRSPASASAGRPGDPHRLRLRWRSSRCFCPEVLPSRIRSWNSHPPPKRRNVAGELRGCRGTAAFGGQIWQAGGQLARQWWANDNATEESDDTP